VIKISKRILKSITKISCKGNLLAKIFISLGTVLIIAAFSMGASGSLVNHNQSEAKVVSYLHVTDLQGAMQELYKMAGKELNYKIYGMNVSAQVSNVNDHSVYVNFYTTYDNTTIHSSSVINKNNGEYSAIAVTGHNSNLQKKNGVIWDPGGTYYYYVTGSSGSGSQTWTFWYTPGSSWSSSSDAYPGTSTFFVTWNGPLFALVFGISSVFDGFNWEASNGVGWSYYSQLLGLHNSGSATVYSYYGTDTTVSVTMGWSYVAGFF
jgi:hypothetical protein